MNTKEKVRTNYNAIIICLIGRPASGKSRLAKEIVQKESIRIHCYPIQVIDTDKLRLNLFGSEFNPKNEALVIKEKKHLIQQFIQQHAHPQNSTSKKLPLLILDDLHYLTSMRQDIRKIAGDLHAYYMSIYLSTPLELCIKWNKERNKENQVPPSVLLKIEEKFDYPGKKYAWDRPTLTFSPKCDDLNNFLTLLETNIRQIVKNSIKSAKSSIKVQKSLNGGSSHSPSTVTTKLQDLDLQTRRLWGRIIRGQISLQDQAKLYALLMEKYVSSKETTINDNNSSLSKLTSSNFSTVSSKEVPPDFSQLSKLNLSSTLSEFFISQRKFFLHWIQMTDQKFSNPDKLFLFLRKLL
ncbi:MAG: hypothetical protein DRO88_05610 [Promethearchaeia archaeon]|nr:MAG: hypothetical protein DRO88_05610 [Candidatus Lokiarchaeia archaeon]